MAKAFNLTAEINLRGPANLKSIAANIRKELGVVTGNVKLNIDTKASKSIDIINKKLNVLNTTLIQAKQNTVDLTATLDQLGTSLSNIGNSSVKVSGGLSSTSSGAATAAKNIKEASTAMEQFGKQSALAIKRFAAFSIVTTGIYALVNAVNSAFKSFIEFDREMIRLQQVTGKGALGLRDLEKEITNLSIGLGIATEDLLGVTTTLAQAGLTAEETRVALRALAKTELAPSFDDIRETTEGAIAAMRQFGIQATELEGALGSINAVAAAFAVEADDIVVAIQRAGGVFAASSKGVSEGTDALNEFIAVFTSVRATTREGAETIATGLRTIFTRIQRADTIKQLREFGIELTDLDGKFVGVYEGIRRLSEGLKDLDPRDIRLSAILEELGGFRQIGKVIPLLSEFATAQKALAVAQKGQNSLTEAQALAQKSLAVQLAQVRNQFVALIRDVGKSAAFQNFLTIVISLSKGLIGLASAFKPILPILGILAAVKGAKALTEFGAGFSGAFKGAGGAKGVGASVGGTISGTKEKEKADYMSKFGAALKDNTGALQKLTSAVVSLENTISSRKGGSTLSGGGKVLGFNKGGLVPGNGGGDRVPALLEGGEVIINRKAVKAYGAGNLVRMNKYSTGGPVPIKALESRQGKTTIFESYSKKYIQPEDQIKATLNKEDIDFDPKSQIINWEQIVRDTDIKYKKLKNTNPDANTEKLANQASSEAFEIAVQKIKGGILTGDTISSDYPVDILRSKRNPLEVKFTKTPVDDIDLLSKLYRHRYKSGSLGRYGFTENIDPPIDIGSLDIVQMGPGQKEAYTNWYNKNKQTILSKYLGGKISGFAEGSPGGISVPSGKGRGKKGATGARNVFDAPNSEDYLRWAKGIYDEYDADPSLVMSSFMGVPMPPEIALADYLLSQYVFERGGAGLSVGKKFVRTPPDKITDELRPFLIPDPSDPTQLGFYEDQIVAFAKQQSAAMEETTKKIKAEISKRKTTSEAQQELFRYALEGVAKSVAAGTLSPEQMATLTPDVLEEIAKSPQAKVFSLPRMGEEAPPKADSLLKSLEEPLSGFRKSGGQTSLAGVIPEGVAKQIKDAIPAYIESLKEDNETQKIGKAQTALKYFDDFISGKPAEKPGHATAFTETVNQILKNGLIQGLVEGGAPKPQAIIGGPFASGKKSKAGKTWREILADTISAKQIPFDGTNLNVGGIQIPLKQILGAGLEAASTRKKVGEANVTTLASLRDSIVEAYMTGRTEVEEGSDFNLTDDEKAAARDVAIVGFKTNLTDLSPYYRKRNGKNPMRVHTGIAKGEDYATIEKLWKGYYDLQMGAAGEIAGRRNQTAIPVSEEDRKTFGIANAQGYDVEMILAALGSTGGKRSAQDAVDFSSGLSALAADVFGVPQGVPTQAKLTISSDSILDSIDGIIKMLAIGGKADGPSFDDVRQQIMDKYPEIDFRISRRKKGRGFGYNLLGALKSSGGLTSGKLKFEQPTNLQQLIESSDKIAGELMSQKLAVGGGPVKLYHGSNTGVNDSVLESFKTKGALSDIATGYGQGAGFFLYTDEDRAIKQAKMRVSGGGFGTVTSGDTSGKPMVLTFDEMLDPKTYDLDYELQKGLVVKWLFDNFDKIKDLVTPEQGMAGIRDILPADREAGIMSNAIKTQTAEGKRKVIYSGDIADIGEGAVIGQIMSRLQAGNPEFVEQFESKLFEKPMGLVLKYVGSTPLKPTKYDILASGGSPNSKIPAMVSNGEALVSPKLAKKIGYSKLNKMNQADRNGMKGFAGGGGISIFEGPGNGTSDSIGPVGLPEGSFVLRAKATKALGLNKYSSGGHIGIRKLRTGGVLSDDERELVTSRAQAKGVTFNAEISAIKKSLIDVAKGIANVQPKKDALRIAAIENREKLKNIKSRAQADKRAIDADPTLDPGEKAKKKKEVDRQATSEIEGIKELFEAKIKEIDPRINTTDAENSAKSLTSQLINTSDSLDTIISRSNSLTAVFNTTISAAEAQRLASEQLAETTGIATTSLQALVPAVDVAREQLAEQQAESFGELGRLLPELTQQFEQSSIGGGVVGAANALTTENVTSQLDTFLSGKLGTSLGSAISGKLGGLIGNLGGPISALGAAVSVVGANLPALAESIDSTLGSSISESPTFAGVAGGIEGAGQYGASGAVAGAAVGGPVGALIGGISGAIYGAVKGSITSYLTKELENALSALTESTGKADKAMEELGKNNTFTNLGKAQVASGAATLAATTSDMNWAAAPKTFLQTWVNVFDSKFWQSAEQQAEALSAQQAALQKSLERTTEFARLSAQRLSDIDLAAASKALESTNPAEAARGDIITEQETRSLIKARGGNIPANMKMADYEATLSPSGRANLESVKQEAAYNTAKAAFIQERRQLGDSEIEAEKKFNKDKQASLAEGQRLVNERNKEIVAAAKLARAISKVTVEQERLLDVYSRMGASLDRMTTEIDKMIGTADDFADIGSGEAKVQQLDTSTIDVLKNLKGYNIEEVQSASGNVANLLGGTESAQQLSKSAVASKVISEQLPAVLRSTQGKDVGAVTGMLRTQLEDLIGTDEASAEIIKQALSEVEGKLESKGDNVAYSELASDAQFLGQISDTLQAGVDAQVKAAEAYVNSMNKVIEANNKINEALTKADAYFTKAGQIRIDSELELSRTLGKNVSLQDQNKGFDTEIRSLTRNITPGGTTNVGDIFKFVSANQQTLAGPTPGITGKKTDQLVADTAAYAEAQRKARKNTNDAVAALKKLADDGTKAANALALIKENQQLAANSSSFLRKALTSSAEELSDMTVDVKAYTMAASGTAGPAQYQSLEFRQQMFRGLDTVGEMLPEEIRKKMGAQLQLQTLEATNPDLLNQVAYRGKDKEGNLTSVTYRQALEEQAQGKVGPETQALIDTYDEAVQTQITANEALGMLQLQTAAKYDIEKIKILNAISTKMNGLVDRTKEEVKASEAAGRAAAVTAGPDMTPDENNVPKAVPMAAPPPGQVETRNSTAAAFFLGSPALAAASYGANKLLAPKPTNPFAGMSGGMGAAARATEEARQAAQPTLWSKIKGMVPRRGPAGVPTPTPMGAPGSIPGMAGATRPTSTFGRMANKAGLQVREFGSRLGSSRVGEVVKDVGTRVASSRAGQTVSGTTARVVDTGRRVLGKLPSANQAGLAVNKVNQVVGLGKGANLGKLGTVGATKAGSLALGTVISGLTNTYEAISDPQKYAAKMSRRASTGAGDNASDRLVEGINEVFGTNLQAYQASGDLIKSIGFDPFKQALDSATGALDGFTDPVGKIVEALTVFTGSVFDQITFVKTWFRSRAIEQNATQNINAANTERYGEQAGNVLSSLSIPEQLRAKDQANAMLEMDAIRQLQDKEGGATLEDAAAAGISTEGFTDFNALVANREAAMARASKEREQLRASENGVLGYFSSTKDSAEFNQAVQSLLDGLKQEREARIAEEKAKAEATKQATEQAVVAADVAATGVVGPAKPEPDTAQAEAAKQIAMAESIINIQNAVINIGGASLSTEGMDLSSIGEIAPDMMDSIAYTTQDENGNTVDITYAQALEASAQMQSELLSANTDALTILSDSMGFVAESIPLMGMGMDMGGSSFAQDQAPLGPNGEMTTYLQKYKDFMDSINKNKTNKTETRSTTPQFTPVGTAPNLPDFQGEINSIVGEVLSTGQAVSRGYDLRDKTSILPPKPQGPTLNPLSTDPTSLISMLPEELAREMATYLDPSLAQTGSAAQYLDLQSIQGIIAGASTDQLQSLPPEILQAIQQLQQPKPTVSTKEQAGAKAKETNDALQKVISEASAGKASSVGIDLRQPGDCCDRIVAVLQQIFAALTGTAMKATTVPGTITGTGTSNDSSPVNTILNTVDQGLSSIYDMAGSAFNRLFGINQTPLKANDVTPKGITTTISAEGNMLAGAETPAAAFVQTFSSGVDSLLSTVGSTLSSWFQQTGLPSQVAASPLGLSNSVPAMTAALTSSLESVIKSALVEIANINKEQKTQQQTQAVTNTTNLLTLDEKSRQFLDDFQKSIKSFGSVVAELSAAAAKLPPKIEITGNHKFDVKITTDSAIGNMKDKIKEEIINELNTKLSNEVYLKSFGAIGKPNNQAKTNARP